MRRLLVSFCMLLMGVLVGCSPAQSWTVEEMPHAPDTVAAFFEYLQTGEYEAAQAMLAEESALVLSEMELVYKDAIFRNLTLVEILEHGELGWVDDDTNEMHQSANVTLSVNAVDFAAVMDAVMMEAFLWAFGDITVRELTDRIGELLVEKMNDNDAPMISETLVVELIPDDGEWRIVADEAFADAVTGGLLSFAEYADGWLDS